MHCEKAGDEYTGRAATCMDVNAKEFVVLPPYWVEGEEMSNEANCWVSMVAPDARPELFHLLRNLFAGVVYHNSLVDEWMHPGNSVRQSHGWRHMPKGFLDKTRVGFPWDSSPNMPTLSGIPPHTSIMGELAKLRVGSASLKDGMAALPAQIRAALGEELDRRAKERLEGGGIGHHAPGGFGQGVS